MAKVRVQDAGTIFDANADETILEAAFRHGIDYPHGCQNGVCGDCKSLLLAGEISRKPVSKLLLPEAEQREGLFLACRSMALSDCFVLPCNREGEAERIAFAGEISAIERVSSSVAIVRVRPEEPFTRYRPGQYASVAFGALPSREYSFANAHGAAELEFHVRRVEGGQVSTHVCDRAKPGDPVSIVAPYGLSYLRPPSTGRLILIASGTGLAPIKAMLHAMADTNHDGEIHVYQCARSEKDLYFVEELQELCRRIKNISIDTVTRDPDIPGSSSRGRLISIMNARYLDLSDATAYLCGSEGLVRKCREALTRLNLPSDQCFADAFVHRPAPTHALAAE